MAGETIIDLQKFAFTGVLQNVVRFFYGIHELLVFLPRESVEREVFFALGSQFGKGWERSEPSIILTSMYNAFEYRFEDVIRNIDVLQQKLPDISKVKRFSPESCILELAIVDGDNPLTWPVLAHEFGHSLDDAEKISESIVDSRIPEARKEKDYRDICVSWTSEVFADLVAARVFGPSAILPLISMELGLSPILKGPSSASITHPPTPFRSRIVRKYLADRGLKDPFEKILSIYDEDQNRKMPLLSEREKKAREQETRMLEYVFNMVNPEVQARVDGLGLGAFSSKSLSRVAELKSRIEVGEPVSSYRVESDESIRGKLDDLRRSTEPGGRERTQEEVYLILGLLNEQPADSCEILTAGWLYKLDSQKRALRKVFAAETVDFNSYADYLLNLDELLLKSLQLASVHQALRTYATF